MIFTLSSLRVIIVTFWMEFDLIFSFFYMKVITMVFWIVLDLMSIFVCMHGTYMAISSELPEK